MQYSIVSFKKVMSASKGARIDANFFHPDFINNEKLVNKKNKIHSFVEKTSQNWKRHLIISLII